MTLVRLDFKGKDGEKLLSKIKKESEEKTASKALFNLIDAYFNQREMLEEVTKKYDVLFMHAHTMWLHMKRIENAQIELTKSKLAYEEFRESKDLLQAMEYDPTYAGSDGL
jgi:predicted S18 family serine protease